MGGSKTKEDRVFLIIYKLRVHGIRVIERLIATRNELLAFQVTCKLVLVALFTPQHYTGTLLVVSGKGLHCYKTLLKHIVRTLFLAGEKV